MKKTYTSVILAAGLLASLVSCSGFLERNPTNSIAAPSYFKTEKDLQMYCNGFIQDYLPGFTTVSISDDAYTDLCATKTGSDFYHPFVWNAQKQTGWSYGNFSFIRGTNFMLENMTRAKEFLPEAKYKHYEGTARFWRGYAHFIKLQAFGNVPWIDHVLQKGDTTLLYGPRDDREYLFHKILEDINYAAENVLGDKEVVTKGRTNVNKWVVLAYKSRICLFEASYRKYHATNPSTNAAWNNRYESSEELFRQCIDASEKLMESGLFSLHNTGKPASDYSELFKSMVIPTDEVIWSREANGGEVNVLHNVTWNYRSTSMGQQYSPTKDLVDMYLTLDGTPITSDKRSVNEEFNNRDWRLPQSIVGPGYEYQDLSGATLPFKTNFAMSWTGYQFNKWCIEKEENYSRSLSNNSVPILRLGEVLLNYAEAKAEVGEMTEDLWEQTIGALRRRAGVKSIYPGSADYVADAFLTEYYNGDGSGQDTPVLDNVMLEIRRERAVELVMENGLRHDDLFRWKLGQKIATRYRNQGWRGIYLTATEASKGFTINGLPYTVGSGSGSPTNYKIANSGADNTWSLSDKTSGYLIYHYALQWDDKMYLDPIPATALAENPKLGQNYGWN